MGQHDFVHFSSGKSNKNTNKTIEEIDIYDDGEELQIMIKANDFLHNMARYMVKVLIDVGKGILSTKDMSLLLEGKKSDYEMELADSEGLYLERIEYK